MIIWGLTFIYITSMYLTGHFMYRYRDIPGYERDTQKQYVIFKMITACLYIALGAIAFNLSGNTAYFWLMPAYILCFAGDLFLALSHEIDNRIRNPHFTIGVVSFTLAQVFFSIVFFRMLEWQISWTLVIPFAVLGFTIFCIRSTDYDFGVNAVPCAVYSFFVGLTGSFGLQMIITYPGDLICTFMGIGAIMFVISDAVLSMKLFRSRYAPWTGALVIFFYFGAMWFLSVGTSVVI